MSFDSPSRFPIEQLVSGKVGDVVAVSDRVWPELLIDAYEHGIFPWPTSRDESIPWCSPRKRALLHFSELKIPRSLEKARRKAAQEGLIFTRDEAFADVIRACAEAARPGQAGTWITDEMIAAYTELAAAGRAHSVEVWRPVSGEGDASADTSDRGVASRGKLIAGIYGVDSGGAFSAESMFHREPNASKLALLELIDRLKAKGSEWLDIQQLTPHLEKLGAREIKRRDYLRLLSQRQTLSGGKLF